MQYPVARTSHLSVTCAKQVVLHRPARDAHRPQPQPLQLRAGVSPAPPAAGPSRYAAVLGGPVQCGIQPIVLHPPDLGHHPGQRGNPGSSTWLPISHTTARSKSAHGPSSDDHTRATSVLFSISATLRTTYALTSVPCAGRRARPLDNPGAVARLLHRLRALSSRPPRWPSGCRR
jgi:hypothetical protein